MLEPELVPGNGSEWLNSDSRPLPRIGYCPGGNPACQTVAITGMNTFTLPLQTGLYTIPPANIYEAVFLIF